MANDLYVTLQGLSCGLVGSDKINDLTESKAFTNLDGSSNYEGINCAINSIVRIISRYASSAGTASLIPKGLGYMNKLNTAQFSHMCKGLFINRCSPQARGFINKLINSQIISKWNNTISNGAILLKSGSLPNSNKKQ